MGPVKIGIVGCGNVSDIYFKAGRTFDILDVVACADLIHDRAKEKAAKHNIPKACSVDELMADPDIEIVVNLTVPKAHAEVALSSLEAGKHVHGEKPLTVSKEDADKVMAVAREKGLLVGCAPDTFMGAGIQTCRKLIDEGWIGEPVGATASLLWPGPEHWHPSPEFFYEQGGGPMFDMGPYYLTALVNLLGPVKRVSGAARITYPARVVRSRPKAGKVVVVETPSHVTGLMEFANGAIGTIVTSYDVWAHNMPPIEIYGTQGSMAVPDPNCFGGPVRVRRRGAPEWTEMPLTHAYADNSRGIGVADMAYAIRTGRKHRASGELAYHVLELGHAFLDAANRGKRVAIRSKCKRPAPLPMDLRLGTLDE